MDTAVAPSTRLAYEERGMGVPVMFIHGLTFNRHTWDPLVERVSGRFRCVVSDLPGHGESAGLPQSFAEVGDRVHALVADLGIARPIVVGHSFGGLLRRSTRPPSR